MSRAGDQEPFLALGPLPDRVNMARCLSRTAAEFPEMDAVVAPAAGGRTGWDRIRFADLERRVDAIARGLRARGVEAGARTCLFVRPGIDLIAITFALFKLGAVPVLADPGMGRKRLFECMRRMQPRVFIGIPLAQAARLFGRSAFASVELSITVGRRVPWAGPTLEGITVEDATQLACEDTSADDPAAILFTSGSTGPPKGVVYTHGMFHAQVLALRTLYGFEPGEVDLACFPLFALFDTALGVTSVFPEIDPSRPGTCDPERIVAAIRESRATSTFGSPAIWRRVVPWCEERGVRLDGLRRVLIAGAPVPTPLIEAFHRVLPDTADVHTPYGATEGLPVSSIAGRELVPDLVDRVRGGMGTCVGRAAPGIDLRLIRIGEDPLGEWSDELEVGRSELGEVCVRGPVVTWEYAEEPNHTALAKISSPEGTWHRMGDVGKLDDEGRLWLHGRKAHLLRTGRGIRTPVPVENVFNAHRRVHRTALVGVGAAGEEQPVLVVEPSSGEMPRGELATDQFIAELRSLGSKCHASADVDTFLFHAGFPVDVRHNAKIHREELKRWAQEELA